MQFRALASLIPAIAGRGKKNGYSIVTARLEPTMPGGKMVTLYGKTFS
jgi:hypothetical protein